MKCIYLYKGREFSNVRLLDDFLIERQPYESKFGDIVFQLSERRLDAMDKLQALEELSKKLLAETNAARRAAKFCYEGEAEYKLRRPSVGTSEFLKGLRDERGKLYFPEFVEGEYWSGRFYEWSKGLFTDDEILVLFDGDKSKAAPIDLGNPNDWRLTSGEFKEEFGTGDQKSARAKIEEKWKNLASMGTQIHNVLELFFSKNKSGNNWRDVLKDPGTRNMHLNTFIKELRDSKAITSDINDKHVKEIVEHGYSLIELLEERFETKDLMFYPEFTLSGKLNKAYEDRTDLSVIGRVDLLVLDDKGTPHIIDYKTSPKFYENYNPSKKLGFIYQLAVYERLLRRAKLYTEDTDVMIAPIKMENFRKEGGKWTFDSVVRGTEETSDLKSLLGDMGKIKRLPLMLDDYLEAPMMMEGNSQNIIDTVTLEMAKLFPRYGTNKTKSYDEALDLIKQLLGEDPNNWIDKETGKYIFKPNGSTYEITVDNNGSGSEASFVLAVVRYYNGAKENNLKTTKAFINQFNKIIKNPDKYDESDMEWPDGTSEWALKTLSKYLTGHWTILDGNALKAALNFGMILFHNTVTNVVEVVKVSQGTNLKWLNSWGPDGKKNDPNYTNLLAGCGENDFQENSRSDSLMLKAVNGNIEMIEAMLVLNNIDFGSNVNLGGIRVINPHQSKTSLGEGLVARNKELLYCWDRLLKYRDNKDNKFNAQTGNIKVLSDVEVCYQEFNNIMSIVGDNGYGGKLSKLKPSMNKLHDALIPGETDVDLALEALHELRRTLEDKKMGMNIDLNKLGNSIHLGVENYTQQYEKTLYLKVTLAILDLNGVQVRQMLKSHDKYFDANPKDFLNEGWSGYYVDNANNFANLLINLVTNIVLEGYQNARDLGSRLLRELRNDVEHLKRTSGYSGILEHTIGNQTSLYDNMTEYTSDGDLMFVNPWTRPEVIGSAEKVKFAKKYIVLLYKTSHPHATDAEIEAKIRTNSKDLFQVPLIKASTASEINTDGWLGWLKNKFKMFSSWGAFKQKLRDLQSEFLSESIERDSKNDAVIFEATNLMDKGLSDNRLDVIAKMRGKYGDGVFERDLERIIGTHTWAYITHDALEDRMPLLKAAYISLQIAGNDLNYDFKNETTYFKDFIKNKVKKESIIDERFKEAKGAIGVLLKATSWMALAFSPVQMSYQALEGIWKDAKLIITKMDGTEAFTFENMKNAAGIVYKDLGHFSDDPTITSGINALYGINDMDAASFVENNSSNNHGIFNFFGKFAMRFSSRPDYYNRMTIFTAQMLKDGSRDAHHIDKNGQLVYNYKEDARFKAYATNDKSDMEAYNKAKSLYYATAALLIREGVKNTDGTVFQMGQPLPKAYSNKEAEAMKAIGDTMYGYYDSTKKSLMQSTFIGSLFMQMRTFWSSKKNQYMAKGGIKAQGKWVYMKNPDGQEMFYAKTADGEVDQRAAWVTKDDPNCSGVHVMLWQGKFEEGILLTCWDIIKRCTSNHNFNIKLALDERANGDEELRKTLVSNIRLMLADLVMLALIGGLAAAMTDWADDAAKEAKKANTSEEALYATFAGLAAKTVKNSSLDFAWWNAILEPSMDWNPFALNYLGNEAKAITNFITGDATAGDTIVKSFSAARQMRPLFTYVQAEA